MPPVREVGWPEVGIGGGGLSGLNGGKGVLTRRLKADGWVEVEGGLWRDPWNGNLLVKHAALHVMKSRVPALRHDAFNLLKRCHENFFMKHPRFWYEQNLIEADAIICVAMSDMRRECAKLRRNEVKP